MSVGLLLITHNSIGSMLLETATRILGGCPFSVEILSVTEDAERDTLRVRAARLTDRLDAGEGVLVLTDLFGSTPANIASTLLARGQVQVLTGLNLPMLVRVFNYPELTLEEIVNKAFSGGKDGVRLCPQRELQTE